MAIHLILDQEKLDDLELIRELGRDKILRISEKLKSIEPSPLSLSALNRELKEVIDDEHAIDVVINQLFSLYALQQSQDLNAADVLEGLREALKKAQEPIRWEKGKIDEWIALEPELLGLFDIQKVWNVVKLLDLAFSYENLLQSSKIITDIRPIFNKKGDAVEGSVISFVLKIDFTNRKGNDAITISLDEIDIGKLAYSCERALLKSKTARDLMVNAAKTPTIICGDDWS